MFQVCPELSADLLPSMWAAAERLAVCPDEWRTAVVMPLFKKGDSKDVNNYRPISPLSHARKLLESAVDKVLRRVYTFHEVQTGFRPNSGCAQLVLQTVSAIEDGHQFLAVLDLNKAFNTASWHVIARLLKRRLPATLAAWIRYFLQPTIIVTPDDDDHCKFLVTLGVPQGSPLSPAIYNIFMDVPAESLQEVPPHISRQPSTFLADDVILRAFAPDGLQMLLDIASDWALRTEMTWNTKPGKSAILVPPHCVCTEPFILSGAPLQVVYKTTYLGMSLTSDGLSHTSLLDRIGTAYHGISAALYRPIPTSHRRLQTIGE